MARFEGLASIRRALSMPDGSALLDVRPDGSQWRWASVPIDRARIALACGIAALTGGWKLYISLPDDPTSGVLEIVGLSKTIDRPEAAGVGPAPGMLLHVKITPTPKAGTQHTYTVSVTDSSATPVEQAAVTLHNYRNNADDIHRANTDQAGVATFAKLALHLKTTTRRVEGELFTTVTSPKLTVSKDGFDTVNLTVL